MYIRFKIFFGFVKSGEVRGLREAGREMLSSQRVFRVNHVYVTDSSYRVL